jgi:hypothetical protein
MKILFKALSISVLTATLTIGCVPKIPAEAPQLSQELGVQLNALQAANITLLHRFFDLKRAAVERFVHEEWAPVFADAFFADPKVQEVWTKVVASDAKERLAFLQHIGPPLQKKLDEKRSELILPLDELEQEVEQQIRAEYASALATNNTLTSFLVSAAEVEKNRQRYLAKVGITQDKVDNAVNQVHDTVDELLTKTKSAEEKAKAAQEYIEKIKKLRDQLRTGAAGNTANAISERVGG